MSMNTGAGAPPGAHTRPFVSVIMPVRDEAAFIARSLVAVLAQDYPPGRVEVIVADGMSTDGTREIAETFQSQHARLRVVDNPGRIAPTGLNAALRVARGDVIVRVDGHCEIAPDYVRRCVEWLAREQVEGVGGPIETVGQTFAARAIAAAMSSSFGVGGSAFRTVKDRRMLVDSVAFPAYTRRAIERAGLFDEELVRNQDDEYNYRLRSLGGRLLLAPEIRSRYYSRGTLRSLRRQYFQYGYWKVRVMQKHPRQMRARQFAPPLFAAALLISVLLSPFFVAARLALAAIACAYVAANLCASALTARKTGRRLFPLLPATFATLHLAYGFGFLAGLVKFRNRWRDRRGQTEYFEPRSLGRGVDHSL
ncbi:MAG TPA: glycosyltransferase family 2 protein [Pyrinomonadaceae bacterium]|jgi:glycosyltransferase involved in cell wall biosynthesis|nr:glycosyltransferase family 2 protein [Pyrinomonadaceae bacterium]